MCPKVAAWALEFNNRHPAGLGPVEEMQRSRYLKAVEIAFPETPLISVTTVCSTCICSDGGEP